MLQESRNSLIVSLRALAVMVLLTGVLYPLAVTGLAHFIFPSQAEGSLETEGGKVIGSRLLGQDFHSPGYFWGRPSATVPPCQADASTGSNLGPSNPALLERIRNRAEQLRSSSPRGLTTLPVDLVTASGSGLDPDISPAAAICQVPRIARARGIPEPVLLDLIRIHTVRPWLGLLGEARINVLEVNRALDGKYGRLHDRNKS